MTPDARHLLLVNPSAGGGRTAQLLPRVEAALRVAGIDPRIVVTTSVEHGCAEARTAAEQGETVVVMSGDGLIGQVGGVLANTGARFGVIPAGRGNDLARVLGIPTEIEGAVEVLASGSVREIDVGEVNGKRYLCIASCGFDSDANRIANEARRMRGGAVYLYAALRALAEWKPARFTLRLDGQDSGFTGYSVGAANGPAYGGGMQAAPGAALDDGYLDVVWVAEMGKLRFLTRVLGRIFKGTHVKTPEVTVRRAREVQLAADRPFAVYADGDHLTDLPATVSVLPGALRIIAPDSGDPS